LKFLLYISGVSNLSGASGTETVNYQCNKCQKQRKLVIPTKLIKIETISGLVELVDVHRCDKGNLSAIKCFIDSTLVVRSQVHIKSTHYGYETDRDFSTVNNENDIYASLGIPSPRKTEMVKKQIKSRNFEGKNIVGIQIKDKIRNREYIFEKGDKGKKFTVKSVLGFIDINLFLSAKVTDRILKEWKQKIKTTRDEGIQSFPFSATRKWIQITANTLESLIFLDEEVLKLIADYLDDNILDEPDKIKQIELDLLVNSTIAFPKSSSEGIQKFNDKQAIVFAYQSPNILILCKDILFYSLTNFENTILDTYIEKSSNRDYSVFLFALSLLVKENFLKIIRLEFE